MYIIIINHADGRRFAWVFSQEQIDFIQTAGVYIRSNYISKIDGAFFPVTSDDIARIKAQGGKIIGRA